MTTLHVYLQRISSGQDSTIGFMYTSDTPLAWILEDEARTVKVYGETRIPAGDYKITLRTAGRWHERMLKHKDAEVRAMHKGMLWLRDVPGFDYILVHPGNTDEDTAGCLLPGFAAWLPIRKKDGYVQESTAAYKHLYPIIANHLEAGGDVILSIYDEDASGLPHMQH